ncbi:MAG: polymerase LigD, ligase domain protein [Gemmatimonadetes bacterium]|nr:polymerase LigD, ligase domain protein [Gemmatimonadota bacterium]
MIGIQPMLAEAASVLPAGRGWLFEPKYDGVRVLARAGDDGVTLTSRKGNSLTRQFPDLVEPLRELRPGVGRDFLVDGEIVSTTSDGFAGFQMLQSRLGVEQPFRVRMLALRIPAALVAFDVLAVGGAALLDRPLAERRQVLEALLSDPPAGIRLGEQDEDGPALLARSLAERWEGLVAKRADSRYQPGQRAATWLKIKAARRQEFVVAGFTVSASEHREFAALVLGYHDERGDLVYAGSVGSGFTRRELADAHQRLRPLECPRCAFAAPPALDDPVRWTEPRLVAEVRFADWTADGRLRSPVFVAFRRDKEPREVVREP